MSSEAIPPGVTEIWEVPKLPRRLAESHKGTYGRVLVLAGSRGMSGAAVLAGSAALRAGAGLVRVACPSEIQAVVAAGNPCYTTSCIPHHADGTYSETSCSAVTDLVAEADVLAVGPGLGNRPDIATMVRNLLTESAPKPIVLDADGLNVLAPLTETDLLASTRAVLTPHPGEFAKLTGKSTAEIQQYRIPLAVEFAKRFQVVVLLKGNRTIVTDGSRLYQNPTGNPGMATGGAGDVLTGVISALLGQGLSPFDGAILGAWVHGRAGDLAAADLTEVCVTATDILAALPRAFREVIAG